MAGVNRFDQLLEPSERKEAVPEARPNVQHSKRPVLNSSGSDQSDGEVEDEEMKEEAASRAYITRIDIPPGSMRHY
eukprot:g5631.t1